MAFFIFLGCVQAGRPDGVNMLSVNIIWPRTSFKRGGGPLLWATLFTPTLTLFNELCSILSTRVLPPWKVLLFVFRNVWFLLYYIFFLWTCKDMWKYTQPNKVGTTFCDILLQECMFIHANPCADFLWLPALAFFAMYSRFKFDARSCARYLQFRLQLTSVVQRLMAWTIYNRSHLRCLEQHIS